MKEVMPLPPSQPNGRYCIISNPIAGGRKKQRILNTIRRELTPAPLLFASTAMDGSAGEAVRKGHEAGMTCFIAVGGDGTIQSVVNELDPEQDCLGLIVAGSGNGFAEFFGYRRNVRQNIQKLKSHQVSQVDTLTVNGQRFVNLAGVGFDAQVAEMVKKSRYRGFQAYFRAVARLMFRSIYWKGSVVLDDITVDDHFLTVVVANAGIFGYGFRIADQALADDGLMTVVLIRRVARWRYLLGLPFLIWGNPSRLSWFQQLTSTRVDILPEQPTPVQADGELFPQSDRYQFEIEPRSLRLMI